MHSYGLKAIPRDTTVSRSLGTQLTRVTVPSSKPRNCQIQVSHGGRSLTSKKPDVSASDSPLEIDSWRWHTRSRPGGDDFRSKEPRRVRRRRRNAWSKASNSAGVGQSPSAGSSSVVRSDPSLPSRSHQDAASSWNLPNSREVADGPSRRRRVALPLVGRSEDTVPDGHSRGNQANCISADDG